MKTKKSRVLAVASFGGHWTQLNRLSPFFDKYDTRFVTTEASVLRLRPEVQLVRDANRNTKVDILICTLQLTWVLLKFRPNMVVSTGALPGVIALTIGRFIGCKTVWIDSIANGEELSMSGKLAGKVVHRWLTQWPSLATENGPLYKGRIL